MIEKYYTPTIEEFHVGFECEMNTTPNNWVKASITLIHFQYLNKWLQEGLIRVKYLDRENIESLGFRQCESFFYSTKGDYRIYSELERIYQIEDLIYAKTLFSGEIRNKSELSRLLKQLEIK